ncbi:hypothetical protein V493_01479 [Pseudogymnoascus sp. VKM F-4281 (FW-2241)]|nr:hypothetical protein V493_01479 [Pseudogymnoascus sp. VKM F-4281 (FW-2241)]
MSMYGTGLPPCPQRTAVIQSREQRNWPPPSGRLEILENALMEGVPGYELINFVPGPAGVVIARQRPESSSSPPSGQPSEGEPTFSSPGLGRTPGFDPNNFRTSLYNPFDDDKPPCSHCAADHENRLCDQGTPCFECLQRDIVDAENCRTSRPCGLCFMNEMPCDAGTPCQNCMFLGFGEVECRPGGISPQKYFPNDDGTIYESQSEDEPYIHLPGTRPTPDFNYSCAFCVAYGHQGCDPRDRPCLPCVQHNRTALQCRFEERCARCIELDVPCDGKMPCSLCANADGLASMMCLGRGDTTIPGAMTSLPAEEGGDIMMGEAGDYPGFGNGFSPAVTGEPFAPAVAPSGAFIDPSLLAQNEVPKVPPGGFFHPPPHVRMQLLPHYRIRTDVHNTGYFDPVPGVHNSWNPFTDDSRCKEVLPNGEPCGTLPAIHCDGGAEHGDEGWSVCGGCRKLAEEGTVHLLEEIEEKKNLFCCATCSQAQMNKFSSGTGFENMETLVDYHCDCDAQMRAWLCYACKYKVIHTVGDRMISTREKLTRDSDNAILCPRCGVEPGDKEAAYHLAKGVARCSSCWYWINYAK